MKTITLDGVEYNLVPVEDTQEKSKVNTPREELGSIHGRYVQNDSFVMGLNETIDCSENNKNIRATEEQAEACVAMSMLSQLIKETNGDWKPCRSAVGKKYVIRFENDEIEVTRTGKIASFLAFKSEEDRDRFLIENRELILKAKPLL